MMMIVVISGKKMVYVSNHVVSCVVYCKNSCRNSDLSAEVESDLCRGSTYVAAPCALFQQQASEVRGSDLCPSIFQVIVLNEKEQINQDRFM